MTSPRRKRTRLLRMASKLKLINKRETGLEPTLGKAWNGKRILFLPN